MRKIVLVFLISVNVFAQTEDCKCDYIKDYYQLVYRAEISYMQNDFDKAYELLKQAEQNCELLNQHGVYEINILAELSLKKGLEEDVLFYVEKLLNIGYKIDYFESYPEFDGITEIKGWKELTEKAQQIYGDWYSNLNFDLRNELIKMIEEDQRVRIEKDHYDDEMKEVDDYNEKRFKEILAEFGYPNEQLIGNYNIDEKDTDISIFAYHIKDIEYFKPLFLEYIRCGKAPAALYASLVDSQDRRRGMFTYGIYQNVTPEQIEDFENLDERRINAGLRLYKQEKLYRELFREKYKEFFEKAKKQN